MAIARDLIERVLHHALGETSPDRLVLCSATPIAGDLEAYLRSHVEALHAVPSKTVTGAACGITLAEGLALQAAILGGWVREALLLDVLSHGSPADRRCP